MTGRAMLAAMLLAALSGVATGPALAQSEEALLEKVRTGEIGNRAE